MDFVGNLQRLPEMKLYCVNLYYIDIFNLRLMSDNTQSYRGSQLSLQSSSLFCASYTPSVLVGSVKMALSLC